MFVSLVVQVQASIQANTYVVSGAPVQRTMSEMLPQMLSQGLPGMGPGGFDMSQLQALMKQMQAAGVMGGKPSEDDDVPDLVGNFEQAST